MFPDCLSDRVRYMRVEPIDLSFGRAVSEKGYYSDEASARLRANHFDKGRDQSECGSAAGIEMTIIT